MAVEQIYCTKCARTKSAEDFYISNDKVKYPEGHINQCKKCLTMHVDNWNADTYLWILQELDVPYIPDEWNKLLATWGKDPSKVTGLTIVGRYLSKMKLKQYKDFRWKDSDFLQEMANKKIEEAMKRQGFGAAEIAEQIQRSTFTLPEGQLTEPPAPVNADGSFSNGNQPVEDYFNDGATDALIAELTDEDKTYLRLKWGKTYKPDEWIELEKLYSEMMESYDIQAAGDKNTLILACKSSLKANQLLDIGDIDGAQKAMKMYDSLMKAGKWTAAQNKADNGEYVDSISELVALCERDGFIPRYYVDTPQDKVDRVIQDLQDYTRNLVVEEMHLGPLLERAVRQIEQDRENEVDDDDEDDIDDLERQLYETDNEENTDEDFEEFFNHEQKLNEKNQELFRLLEEDQ